jgi:hypothetical protein
LPTAPRILEHRYSVLDGVVVGNLLISLLKHADRVTSASTQPGVLLAIHNASLVGASPGTHRGHTVKSSNSKQGKTTTGLIPSDSQRIASYTVGPALLDLLFQGGSAGPAVIHD